MFNDNRSKSIVFVAHCILNQNANSDGTASYPAFFSEVLNLIQSTDYGIVQMPCPEFHCLGLDRGDTRGGTRPVLEENTRIRKFMSDSDTTEKNKQLIQHVSYQIIEYLKYGFNIKGVIGINRSPSCGVESTSINNEEQAGEGVFIEGLRSELVEKGIHIDFAGIKAHEPEKSINILKHLFGLYR